ERTPALVDTEVAQALAADAKRQRIFKRLEAGEEAVRLDRDPRAGGRGTGLLEVADELLDVDRAAFIQAENPHVGIDHHHGFNVDGNALQQAADGARLAAVDAVIKT